MQHTSGVELFIAAFGGVRRLARAISRDPAAVSRWRKTGNIPVPVLRKLITMLRGTPNEISSEHALFGRLQ